MQRYFLYGIKGKHITKNHMESHQDKTFIPHSSDFIYLGYNAVTDMESN